MKTFDDKNKTEIKRYADHANFYLKDIISSLELLQNLSVEPKWKSQKFEEWKRAFKSY